jgi:NADPH-dependent 2,4-dienoyl-CoA reductase/sulfur reductase-like enzyme
MTIDVAVVGAGPAGLAAATRCATFGLATSLYDEQLALGGQIYRGITDTTEARRAALGAEYARGTALVDAFRATTAVHVPLASVWMVRALPDGAVELGVSTRAASGDAKTHIVRARAAILATGAQERPCPIPGWTLPGVMTVGAAQILLKTSGLVPQGRVVIAGSGPLLWLAAAQLQDAGATLAALIETVPRGRLREALAHAPAFVASPYFRKGLDLARRVRRRTRVIEFVESLAAVGEARVEALRYMVGGETNEIAADHLLLHQGVVPSAELAGAAGCALRWNDLHACVEPVVDAWGGTTIASLFVAGDGAGIAGADAAAARGSLAALAVANALGRIDHRDRDRDAAPLVRALADAQRGRRFFDVLYRPADAFRIPSGDTIVCRCEEVTAQAVVDAARNGCVGPNQAKAWLRCGMGPCQGRSCASTVTELIARTRGVLPANAGTFRHRFPVKPLTLAELASLPQSAVARAAVVRE